MMRNDLITAHSSLIPYHSLIITHYSSLISHPHNSQYSFPAKK